MFTPFFNINKSPEGFLHWWNENPIVLGGDRYSDSPGLAVYYIQHSGTNTFEIRVEPIQPDQLEFTQYLLGRVLGDGAAKNSIKVRVKSGQTELAVAVLYVDDQRRWASGEGCWNTLKGHPRNWELVIDEV
jgi:hypothetical protein